MTSSGSHGEPCREWREQIGMFAIGRLQGDERAAFRAHLDGCQACRDEAAQLEAVASLLPAADPARIQKAPPVPAGLAERVVTRVGEERRAVRRRRRTRFGLGAAAAAATAAAVAAIVLTGGSSGPPPEHVAFPSLPANVHLAATLHARPWGTAVALHVRGIRSGTVCHVWLRRRGGGREPAGSFRYVYDRSDNAALAAALPRDRAVAIGVRAGPRTFVAPLSD